MRVPSWPNIPVLWRNLTFPLPLVLSSSWSVVLLLLIFIFFEELLQDEQILLMKPVCEMCRRFFLII